MRERRGGMEADRPDGAGPASAEQTVDFGWEDDAPKSSRRQKMEREQKRKLKPGSFGESRAVLFQTGDSLAVFHTSWRDIWCLPNQSAGREARRVRQRQWGSAQRS